MSHYPSPTAAWRVVGLLSLLYCLSFVDRMILSLLVSPIKAELALSDTQIGILFGLSFATLYTLAGLPLARIADGGDRRRLIVLGVVVWSASTVLSGFAQDYGLLLTGRAGVAIGEAVLTPTAISLIADLFPKDRRAGPTSVYSAVGTVSGLAAFFIGGAVFDLAVLLSPELGGFEPWRLTLILVGAPGLLLAVVFLLMVREPVRQQATAKADTREVLVHIAGHWRVYGPVFLGIGLTATVGYAVLGWTPRLLGQRFGLATADAGYLFGAVGVFGGLVGTLALPWLAAKLDRTGRGDGLPLVGMGFVLAGLPALLVAFTTASLALFTAMIAIGLIALLGVTLIPSLMVQQISPGRQRAQIMAVYLLVANLLGLGAGPTLTGLLADHVFKTGGVGPAILLIAAVMMPLAAILLWTARAGYVRMRGTSADGQ